MTFPHTNAATIRQAAEADYAKQRTYSEAYDRIGGFEAGARWMEQHVRNLLPTAPLVSNATVQAADAEARLQTVISVAVGELYRHHRSQAVYVVIKIANTTYPPKPQYPMTVVYQNIHNGAVFARPAATFTRDKFTPITRESDPTTYWAWRHRDAP